MTASFEITDRFIEPGELLHTTLPNRCTYRQTRRYDFEYEGDEIKLNTFVADTLVDKISQTMIGAQFAIDSGMKPGGLDLEKETIVSYFWKPDNPGFALKELTIRQRIYVFPEEPGDKADPEIFLRDICNGAIHNWSVIG